MAAEVVGTAYVAIRALTNKLASDIKDGLDKGVADADVDGSGKDVGDRVGRGVTDGAGERIRADLPGELDGVERDGKVRKRSSHLGKSLAQRVSDGFKDRGAFRNRVISNLNNTLKSIRLPGGAISWFILLGLPAFGAALKIIAAGINILVAQLGNIVTAAAGAGAALIGAVGALGLGLVPIVLGFKVETDQLLAFKDVLKDTGDLWKEVGIATQTTMLPGLVAAVRQFEALIPTFKFVAPTFGQIVSDTALLSAAAITSEENMGFLNQALASTAGFWENIGASIVNLAGSLPALLAVTTPLAEDLSISVRNASENFRNFITDAARGGELSEKLDTWWERFKRIARILADIAAGLFGIFEIGADVTDPMFENLEGIAQRFRDFTNTTEGQNAIRTYFENSLPVAQELFGLFGDIIKLIAQPFATGETDGLVGFLQSVRQEWLPALANLGGVIKDATNGVLGDFADELLRFIEIIGDNPELGGNIFGLFATNIRIFTQALSLLNDVLSTDLGAKVANIVLPIIILARTAATLGVLAPVLGAITAAVSAIGLGTLVVVFAAAAIAVGAFIAAWKNWDRIVGFIKDFPLIAAAIGILAAVIAPGALVIIGAVALIKNWEKVVEFFKELPGKLRDAVGRLPEIFDSLLETIREIPERLSEIGGGLILAIQNIDIGEILSKLGDFGADMLDAATGWIADIAPDAGKLLGKAFGTVIGFFLRLPFEILAIGVDILAAALEWALELPPLLIRALGKIAELLLDLFFDLPGIIGGAMDGFGTFVIGFFRNLPSLIFSALQFLGYFIIEAFRAALPQVADGAGSFIGSIVDFFKGLPALAVEAIKDLGSALGSALSGSWEVAKEGATEWFNSAVEFFSDLPGKIVGVIDDVGSALSSMFGALWDIVKIGAELLAAAAVDFFSKLPGRIVDGADAVGSELSDMLRSAWGTVQSGASSLLTSIANFFKDLPGRIVSAAANVGLDLKNLLSDAWDVVKIGAEILLDNAVEFFRNLPQNIYDAVIETISVLGQLGKDIVNAIVDGIGSIGDAIRDKIMSFVPSKGDILDAVGGFLSNPVGAGVGLIRGSGGPAGLVAANVANISASTSDSLDSRRSSSGASSGASFGSLINADKIQINEPVDLDQFASTIYQVVRTL